jgi:hypothetical protein
MSYRCRELTIVHVQINITMMISTTKYMVINHERYAILELISQSLHNYHESSGGINPICQSLHSIFFCYTSISGAHLASFVQKLSTSGHTHIFFEMGNTPAFRRCTQPLYWWGRINININHRKNSQNLLGLNILQSIERPLGSPYRNPTKEPRKVSTTAAKGDSMQKCTLILLIIRLTVRCII